MVGPSARQDAKSAQWVLRWFQQVLRTRELRGSHSLHGKTMCCVTCFPLCVAHACSPCESRGSIKGPASHTRPSCSSLQPDSLFWASVKVNSRTASSPLATPHHSHTVCAATGPAVHVKRAVCTNCRATSTPQWRTGPAGEHTLCSTGMVSCASEF